MTWSLIFLGNALAATITVGPSGADYTTVGEAIAAASSGDTISVGPGLYTECLDTDGKDLQIVGVSPWWTALQGDGSCDSTLTIDDGEDVTVSSLTLMNATGRAAEVKAASLLVQDALFVAVGVHDEDWQGGALRVESGELTVADSRFLLNDGGLGSSIYATDGATVTLTDSELEDGVADAGAIYLADADDTVAASSIALEGCTLSGHRGGVLYAGAGATVDSADSTWEDNVDHAPPFITVYLGEDGALSSTGDLYQYNEDLDYKTDTTGPYGGAIQAADGTTLTIDSSTFLANVAYHGGAVHQLGSGSTLTIADAVFEENVARSASGAVRLVGGTSSGPATTASISGSSFSGNVAGYLAYPAVGDYIPAYGSAGAMSLSGPGVGSTLTLTDSSFESNVGGADAGALYLGSWDSVVLEDVVLDSNRTLDGDDDGGRGGAVFSAGVDDLQISGLRSDDNSTDYGGSLYITGTKATITGSTFTNDKSSTNGGALYSTATTLEVYGSTFCQNNASSGGVAYGSGTTWTWTNNLIYDNGGKTRYLYGGLYVINATAALTNNTFVGNTGTQVYGKSAKLTMVNNILARTTGTGVYGSGTGATASFSYDDWYSNTSNVLGSFTLDTSTSGHLTTDPLFTDYNPDTDCTNDDLTLAAGSPLIDAGDPSLLDTDGSRSDMGAYGGSGASVLTDGDTGDTGDTGAPGGDGAGSGDTGDSGDSGDTVTTTCWPATGGVLTVGPDGDCPTISSAVNAAVDGDRIEVSHGLYRECVDLGGKDLEIVGVEGSLRTWIWAPDGCEAALDMQLGEDATITGFSFGNPGALGLRVVGGSADLEDVVIAYCGVYDLSSRGEVRTLGAGIYLDSGSLSVVDGELFDDRAKYGSAIYATGSVSIALTDVAIHDNLAKEATIYLGAGTSTLHSSLDLQDVAFEGNEGGEVESLGYLDLTSADDSYQNGSGGRAIRLGNYGSISSTDDVYSDVEGGIYAGKYVTMIVSGDSFQDVVVGDYGGAIFLSSSGSLTLSDSSFEGGQGQALGGAVLTASSYTISGCAFSDNDVTKVIDDTADAGYYQDCGAIYASAVGTIEDSTFDADLHGEICIHDTAELSGLTFTGASTVYAYADVVGEDLVFLDSASTTALYVELANADLSDVVLRDGGGVSIVGTDGSTIQRFVSSRTDSRNYSGLYLNPTSGTSTVEDSWFCGLSAGTSTTSLGGAIKLVGGGGTVSLANNVFVENSAKYGGAIYSKKLDVDATNNTFVGNKATTAGGTAWFATSTGTWDNNIVAWTQAYDGVVASDTSSGTGVVFTYDDWYSNTSIDRSGYFTFSTSAAGNTTADPGFVAYSLDGDCTNDSLWLDSGSPLIDAGDPTILDDDGSVSDIGAWSGMVTPDIDWDGDRYLRSEDCDDSDPSVHPGATEVCGGGDEDCDGETDEAGASGEIAGYADLDGDGYGDPSASVMACPGTAGVVANTLDCDDGDAKISPDAAEICDDADVDEDCDGLADDDDDSVTGTSTFYTDADGDGHGDPSSPVSACDLHDGISATADDCDDTSAGVYPGAVEVCDDSNIDEDCDGLADDADDSATGATTWYADTDGDGYGDPAVTATACDAPDSYVATAGDCDDANAAISPAAAEICDDMDVDEDCDGLADDLDPGATGTSTWYADTDGDGYGDPSSTTSACDASTGYTSDSTDCDDSRSDVSPGGTEVCDALNADEDCDGLSDDLDPSATGKTAWYADSDGDGYGDPSSTMSACDAPTGTVAEGTDCADGDARTHPGAEESDCTDPADYNCDGSVGYADADGDGWAACAECDDGDASVFPGATEIPDDGIDQDCDGEDATSDTGDTGDTAETGTPPETGTPTETADTSVADDSSPPGDDTSVGGGGGSGGPDSGDGTPGCTRETGCAGGSKESLAWLAPLSLLLLARRRR